MKTFIIMNSKIFLNTKKLDKTIKNDVSSSFHPKNFKREDVVIHELAHYITLILNFKSNGVTDTKYISKDNIEKYITAAKNWGEYDEKITQDAYDNYVARTKSTVKFDDFRATISKYAMAKDDNGDYIYGETVAEAFSDVMINGDSAVEASKEVVKVLDKRVKDLK
jgi:hypothetical protein